MNETLVTAGFVFSILFSVIAIGAAVYSAYQLSKSGTGAGKPISLLGGSILEALQTQIETLEKEVDYWSELYEDYKRQAEKERAELVEQFAREREQLQGQIGRLYVQIDYLKGSLRTDTERLEISGVVQLHDLLNEKMSESEIQDLVFSFGSGEHIPDGPLDYENLPGDSKRAKIRSLISFAQDRGILPYLAKYAAERRPDLAKQIETFKSKLKNGKR